MRMMTALRFTAVLIIGAIAASLNGILRVARAAAIAVCLSIPLNFGSLTAFAAPSAQATADINALIAKIEIHKGLRFIRNGKEYSAAHAAEFLRRKWKEKCAQVDSIEQFIETCATKSSTSGLPYQVKLEGQTRPAADWLRELSASLR